MNTNKTVAVLWFGAAAIGVYFMDTSDAFAATAAEGSSAKAATSSPATTAEAAPAKSAASVAQTTPAQPAASAPKGIHFAAEIPGCDYQINWALDRHYSLTPSRDMPPEMADRSKLEIQPPIAYYSVSTEDVLGGKGLAAPKLQWFMYYIKASGKTVATMKVNFAITEKGPVPMPGLMDSIGPNAEQDMIAGEMRDIARIKTLDQVGKGSYELRELVLPPFVRTNWPGGDTGGMVFWLKSDTPGGDLIYTRSVAVEFQQPGLQPSTLYTVPEVLKLIEPAVKAYLDLPPLPPFTPPSTWDEGALGGSG